MGTATGFLRTCTSEQGHKLAADNLTCIRCHLTAVVAIVPDEPIASADYSIGRAEPTPDVQAFLDDRKVSSLKPAVSEPSFADDLVDFGVALVGMASAYQKLEFAFRQAAASWKASLEQMNEEKSDGA